uniref:Uncharacterized protein n=1 Tax=Sarcophilus harrisii TaxID=9305 RepID=A0A7N4V0P2_SARHA
MGGAEALPWPSAAGGCTHSLKPPPPVPLLSVSLFICKMLSLGQMLPDLAQPMAAKDQEDEGCGEQHGGTELPPRGPLLGSWHQDVNLACKSCPEEGASRAWTTFYYNLLQSCLQQAGLPETGDRSLEPHPGCPGAEVTMCILGSPSSFFSVLLEGGAQSPGNSLLCLSPSWLSKVPVAGEPGDSALLVSKAVAFYPGGLSFLEEFAPPEAGHLLPGGAGAQGRPRPGGGGAEPGPGLPRGGLGRAGPPSGGPAARPAAPGPERQGGSARHAGPDLQAPPAAAGPGAGPEPVARGAQ